MSPSNIAHGRKCSSKKESSKLPKKHSHPSNSWVKKTRVTLSYARRSSSQRKLSHVQLFQLLPIPKGKLRDDFESAVSAFRKDTKQPSTSNQKSFDDKAPPDDYFSKLRRFDRELISKTPVWIVAQALNAISMDIEQFDMEKIGTAGDHAYIIECVLNEHLNKDKPVSFVNKHQPKLEFVNTHGNITSLTTVITYLPATNCFYSIFAPMPYGRNGYIPLPAEWLRLTRYGSRPNTPYRKAGQPAKGAFIQEITKVYRMFVIDKKNKIYTDGRHVGDYSIPLPPDWPVCTELRASWPSTTTERRVAYYDRLLKSTKNVSLGKRFVPGILYNKLPDATTAFIVDARNMTFEEEHVLRLVHSVDDGSCVDYQSTLRVRRLNFKEYPVFQKGLAMVTRKLKIGNPTTSSVRNQHGDGFGQMYPLGTHMHNGKYAVYAKSVCVTKEVLSALMPCYRKVLTDHIPFDLHAIDGHAEYHGMRPIELMGGSEGVTNSINVSRNLENPPHHDVGDLGNGSSVWYEEYPGTAKQWNFVCPNVIVKCPLTGATKNGLIVRLCHGAMIDWDGLYTRHCTSMCDKGSVKNNLWGVHLTNNHPSLKEFQMKLEKETMELEVARDEQKKQFPACGATITYHR